MDIPTYANDEQWKMHPGLVEDRETSLLGALEMHEKWNGRADDRIRVWFGARTPGGYATSLPHPPIFLTTATYLFCSVSESLYKEMAQLSQEKNIPITMHLAECPTDTAFFASRSHTATSYCSSLNLLSPTTVLVHMVHLDSTDIANLAATGTHVVHCPTSNTKLASGIAPVPALQAARVNVALGTDGAPCNNTCDMLREMHLASILHKVATMAPTSVPAETVLEMATINGARALGLAHAVGSLEVGKKADFCALDFRRAELVPWSSAVGAVVYAATGRDVELVVVDGKIVVSEGRLLTMDEEAVVGEAVRRSRDVVARAGLTDAVKGAWPVV